MKKNPTLLSIVLLSTVIIISCSKLQQSPLPTASQTQKESKVVPNVPSCPSGQQWDFYLGKCVPICPSGYHNDSTTGACVINGSSNIPVVTNPNNPYDYAGLQHNNGVTYLLNHVNPSSPTLNNDILHYTKVYGSTINLDTTGFDSWYSYATAHGYFYLNDTVYIVSPNPLNTKLYNNARISSNALTYLNSINNAIDNVISDNSSPSSSLYVRIANQLVVIENNIKNDGALGTDEKSGLLRVAAINRYTGAYWANYINNAGNGGSTLLNSNSISSPALFKSKWWRRFWHADGVGAIAGAAGGALAGWAGALWGAVLGAAGGSAAYAIFGD